ncbi:hypothetical protein [Halostella salina]|uniref:hypothetical protein n=1 Tax=Halostella salina TaxID=1547897 RepID=UPI0013CE9A93|nr:hypothetical protein [Halostella salina]
MTRRSETTDRGRQTATDGGTSDIEDSVTFNEESYGTDAEPVEELDQDSRAPRIPLFLWVIGAVPIFASTLQALSALTGVNLVDPIPLIGTIAVTLRDTAVLGEVAAITFSQSYVVLILFALTAIASCTQAVAQFTTLTDDLDQFPPGDRLAFFAFGLSGIVYVLLSLMYLDLFNRGVPAGQIAMFYTIPVIVLGSLYSSYRLHPWERVRRKEALRRIVTVKNKATNLKQSFQQDFEQNVGTPVQVFFNDKDGQSQPWKPAKRSIANHASNLNRVIGDAEKALDNRDELGTDELEERAAELEAEANEFPVNFYSNMIDDQIRDAMEFTVEEQFDGSKTAFDSRFGEQYSLHEERSLNSIDETIVLSEEEPPLSEQLVAIIRHNPEPITDIETSLAEVDEWINELDSQLDQREAVFEEKLDKLESELEIVESAVDSIGGPIGETLDRYWIQDVCDYTVSAAELQNRKSSVIERFHGGRENPVNPTGVPQELVTELEESIETARDILVVLEDIEYSVIDQLDSNSDTITQVDDWSSFGSVWTAELQAAFTNAVTDQFPSVTDLEFKLSDNEITVKRETTSIPDQDPGETEEEQENPGEPMNEGVIDIIERIKMEMRSANSRPVELTLDQNDIATEETINQLIEFLRSEGSSVDLVEETETDERIKITSSNGFAGTRSLVAEGQRLSPAVMNLGAEYENWATNQITN